MAEQEEDYDSNLISKEVIICTTTETSPLFPWFSIINFQKSSLRHCSQLKISLSYALYKASSFLSVTNCTEETW